MKKKMLLVVGLLVQVSLLFSRPPALPNVGNSCYMNLALQNFYNMSLLTDIVLFNKEKMANVSTQDKSFYVHYEAVVRAMFEAHGGTVSEKYLVDLSNVACKRAQAIIQKRIKELKEWGADTQTQEEELRSVGPGKQNDVADIIVSPVLGLLPSDVLRLFLYEYIDFKQCLQKNTNNRWEAIDDGKKQERSPLMEVGIQEDTLETCIEKTLNGGEIMKFPESLKYTGSRTLKYFHEKFVVFTPAEYAQKQIDYWTIKGTVRSESEWIKKSKEEKYLAEGFYVENCRMSTFFSLFPDYLIIRLKRYDVNFKKNAKKVSIPMDLNLTAYGSKDVDSNMGKYSLIGSAEHSGTEQGGHYVAYIKDQFDAAQPWYYCSDSSIQSKTQDEVLKALESEAYVLFYIRNDKIPEVKELATRLQGERALKNLGNALSSLARGG